MKNFEGKIAVVTGGNSGIGFETARQLALKGATVIITGRNKEAVLKAAAELDVEAFIADQSDVKSTERLVSFVKEKFGKVDILVINAGIASRFSIEEATENRYDDIMNINVKGAYFTLSKFTPLLSSGGSVVFISSIVATLGLAGNSVYAASKAAVNSIVKSASTELAARNIRVNSVSPGPIVTPINAKLGFDDEFVKKISSRVPLKRMGQAVEVAKLVAYLSSEEASFITGADYLIDGGLAVNPVFS
jgi:NAD(P)-dependent dehydrogenase (short-subunit alcohol dehydrogenase family)